MTRAGITGVDDRAALHHLNDNPRRGCGTDVPVPRRPTAGADPMPVKKETKYHAWYWIAAIFAMMIIQALFASYTQIATIPYSQYQDDLKAGKIAEVRVSGNYIQGKFKEPDQNGYSQFITTRVDPATAEELSKYNVKFAGTIESTLLRDLLSWIIPIALFAGVWFFMYRRFAAGGGAGGLMSIGRSKAKVYVETDTKTTFADVAGVDEAKAELQEIVAVPNAPVRYGRLGGRVPKGVLLVGPPGTGKTLLARAVAGEAHVPFFSINGSEFVEMFVGVGAARVRDLFETAKDNAPCVVFIDEIDAVGRMRGAGVGGGSDEREQTLNQILGEMDGFQPSETVIVIAATNRPDVLDTALLRPGRFDRHITVDKPTVQGREEILKVHTRNKPLSDGVDLERVARNMVGMSGADLQNLANEAALHATRAGRNKIEQIDFDRAADRVRLGAMREEPFNDTEKRRTAYHEAGHALCAALEPKTDKIDRVSIIPRGQAGGVTMFQPDEEKVD